MENKIDLNNLSDIELCIYYIDCSIRRYESYLQDKSYLMNKNRDICYCVLSELKALKNIIINCKEKVKY